MDRCTLCLSNRRYKMTYVTLEVARGMVTEVYGAYILLFIDFIVIYLYRRNSHQSPHVHWEW